MNPSTRVLAIFSLAAFLLASISSCCSAWLGSLSRANQERRAESDNSLSPGYHPGKADEIWEAENIRISKYADRFRPIFYLSFPVALNLALVVALGAGWLPRFSVPRMFAAMIPVYLAPGLVILLSGLSWGLLLIPTLALAAYLMRWSVEILTSRRPQRFVLTLLISIVLCSLLYVVVGTIFGDRNGEPIASAIFIITMEMTAAGLYGKSLTPPIGFAPQPETVANGRLSPG